MRKLTPLLFAGLLVSGLSAQSTDRIDKMLAELERVHQFGSVSISPDGENTTWIERRRARQECHLPQDPCENRFE